MGLKVQDSLQASQTEWHPMAAPFLLFKSQPGETDLPSPQVFGAKSQSLRKSTLWEALIISLLVDKMFSLLILGRKLSQKWSVF